MDDFIAKIHFFEYYVDSKVNDGFKKCLQCHERLCENLGQKEWKGTQLSLNCIHRLKEAQEIQS